MQAVQVVHKDKQTNRQLHSCGEIFIVIGTQVVATDAPHVQRTPSLPHSKSVTRDINSQPTVLKTNVNKQTSEVKLK